MRPAFQALIENKFGRMVELGKVTAKNIARAKKAGGIIKPYATWQKGMETGTKNIIKQSGWKVKRDMLTPVGSHAMPVNKTLHLVNPKISNPADRNVSTLINRHEADEVRTVNKLTKKIPALNSPSKLLVGAMSKMQKTGAQPNPFYGVRNTYHGHMHPNVLMNERKYVNVGKKIYGKESGADDLIKMRAVRNEYASLKGLNKNKIKRYETNMSRAANAASIEADSLSKKEFGHLKRLGIKMATGAFKPLAVPKLSKRQMAKAMKHISTIPSASQFVDRAFPAYKKNVHLTKATMAKRIRASQ